MNGNQRSNQRRVRAPHAPQALKVPLRIHVAWGKNWMEAE